MTDQALMTFQEICDAIGARRPSVEKALDALDIKAARLDLSDRRRLVYPAGTAERVRQWLLEHTEA